jgi:hypothetical protein
LAGERANAYTVAALADGTVWVSGALEGPSDDMATLIVTPSSGSTLSLETAGLAQFVARLDPEGVPAWAISFESDLTLGVQALAASPSTTVAVGMFTGLAQFGSAEHELSGSATQRTFITLLGP